MMERNPYASDYIPLHKFKNTKIRDVAANSFIHIEDPPQGWANPTDCGAFPCTAPDNVVLVFENTQYSGTNRPAKSSTDFTIVSNVPTATEAYAGCETMNDWNVAYCNNDRLGVLLFESLDGDTMDRSVQPIIITSEDTGYENTLNSYMDHIWDGFYTGQLRLSRFPSQIEVDQDYLITMTGTPPNSMRYKLDADTGGVKLKIYYPNAGAYNVYANGVYKDMTQWDVALGSPSALTKSKGCGENRYVGVVNFLEFYLTTDCEIKIEPLDQIYSSVRLSWTLDEFYADGGTTTFTDRVSAALGVPSWRVKTVAVYEGSVIVDFFIVADADEDDPESELANVGSILVDALTGDETNWLGAPIISSSSGGVTVVDNSDFYDGNTGTSTLIADFLEDLDNQASETTDDDDDADDQTDDSQDASDQTDQAD